MRENTNFATSTEASSEALTIESTGTATNHNIIIKAENTTTMGTDSTIFLYEGTGGGKFTCRIKDPRTERMAFERQNNYASSVVSGLHVAVI